jgi:hypothetical protein
MARPNLTIDEADELAHFGIPATSDVQFPSQWRPSVAGVPVQPVPDIGSHLFVRTIRLYRVRLTAERREEPRYALDNNNYPAQLAEDRRQ